MKKRILSILLTFCILLGLVPTAAFAAPRAASVQPAHQCAATAVTAATLAQLQSAVNSGAGDILLSPAGDGEVWTVTQTMTVPNGRTVHIRVAQGKSVTLQRGSAAGGIELFRVDRGGRLILGDGQVSYNGATLTESAQKGDYTITGKPTGSLILDGGATWTRGSAYTPGDNVGDSVVMYDDDGKQYRYTTGGVTASSALIQSSGTLDVWNGVTLQNNVLSNGVDSYGSAIQSLSGSTLNLFGGQVTRCAVSTSNNDTGRGAVFIGSFVTGNWNAKPDITDSHFNMYGGAITNNATTGSNQDGGGVSVETAHMDLYGGEISYNHGGLGFMANYTGDGGGVMVRNNAQFTMWGGSVDHNFAGGYGGGIVAWNAQVNIKGGSITGNKASYGGGVAIASSNNDNANVTAKVVMEGGTIAYNEAINSLLSTAGIGGGICVGAGSRTMGCSLDLTGGSIRQNTAVNGGGMGVYAGGGQAEGDERNTSAAMSGNFQLTTNSADQHGNGMYIENTNAGNRHYLVKLSGGATVDTNNPVYFANVTKNQTPIRVTDTLTAEGTAAIFEFSDGFWSGSDGSYAKAEPGKRIVAFDRDVQENKIALESSSWYLGASGQDLVLQNTGSSPQYTIRNGTPVTVSNKVYYRVYADLTDAVNEAADGDVLYIFYNTTVDTPAKVSGKRLTLMAESTSSASRDAALSGSGATKTCWLENSGYGYTVMRGNFLQYVGSGGTHNASGGTTGVCAYRLTTTSADLTTGNTLSFNIRNDYTITLSSRLYLGESAKGAGAGEAAITVESGAALEVGQVAAAGMGAGALTFDGNFSSPKEGSMFQVGGALTFHSGVTVKNHTNYSLAHPGTVEVRGGGTFTMEDGSAISGGVCPIAGAVYVAGGGSFTMGGGSISGNTGAMPRYGFFTGSSRLKGYDSAYWGQAKYYMGAGAVYNLGSFTMTGGSITGNWGEYGALANLGGAARLSGGSISENTALKGTGEGKNALTVSGYTEGAKPAIPAADAYSPDAASGGGVYCGGGTVEVGAGFSITKNTAQTGGGLAVGRGRDISRSVSGYDAVSGGVEYLPDRTAEAREARYAAPTAAETQGSVSVQGGSVTDNAAQALGGGLAVSGQGARATVASGVVFQRNTAQAGGGLAAHRGGQAVFRNELTENTATCGGGVYVGGGSSVTAQGGSLTANRADHGGGAYVDSAVNGEYAVSDPGTAAGTDVDADPGALILAGATVNNNRLSGGGLGTGVYDRGDVRLMADGGVQSLVSYNDHIYLERGHTVKLDESYDISKSYQTSNNRLTLDSRVTENGTLTVQAASADQAAATLGSGLIAHRTHPMAIDQDDRRCLELNSIPVYYYDRCTPRDGLDSHMVQVPYASGDTVILQSFTVGENDNFQLPEGKSFLYWVTVNEKGEYLDFNGQVVDSAAAARYYAGSSIAALTAPVYLEAVYGSVQYYANLLIQDEEGNQVDKGTWGSISLPDASYNSVTGDYTFAMGTPLTINVTPVRNRELSTHTLLQGLSIYEKVDQPNSDQDIQQGGSWWTPVVTANMETETLDVPGGSQKTVCSSGVIDTVNVIKAGTTAEKVGDNAVRYVASNADILIVARFKKGMVRMDVADRLSDQPVFDPTPAFTGYYDTMHEAVTAAHSRISAAGGDKNSYTFTLLAPNNAAGDNFTVRYFGQEGEDPGKCLDNNIVGGLPGGAMVYMTYDLNDFTLDYQSFGERNLKNYNMTIRNGVILYHGNTDRTSTAGPNSEEYRPSAFRIAEGTLTLENVTINTDRTVDGQVNIPAGGRNDKVYSAKVMEKGTLNIGQGCHLGDVFVFTDREEIKTATAQNPSRNSGHVTVTDTFVEGRTEPVAELCLAYWDFSNQVRRVIVLSDDVATAEGVAIRRLFALKDVDDIPGQDEAKYWFIGTDGFLYQKVAAVRPSLIVTGADGKPVTGGGPLDVYWDYNDDPAVTGRPIEIGGSEDDPYPGYYDNLQGGGHVSWVNGYPFYYDYTSQYGFDPSKYTVSIQAALLDGKGAELPLDRGTMSYTVSRIIHNPDGTTTNRRNFGGILGMDKTGYSTLPFPTLSALPATATPDVENWERPDSYYVVSALWSGAGQYAPQYAQFWNYSYGIRPEFSGISGGTVTGALRLSHLHKPMSDPDITVVDITPRNAEYIGPEGARNGYTSAPTIGRIQDAGLGSVLQTGTDYNIYYAALISVDDWSGEPIVMGEDGRPLEVENVVGGQPAGRYYYLASHDNQKLYYGVTAAGNESGDSPENARRLNGAPAGPYSVALEADTLAGSNYDGQSGWKNTLFRIRQYSGSLDVDGPNHVVVAEGESYQERIQALFQADSLEVKDRYGNTLALGDCAFTFDAISGGAQLDSGGWPQSEGLYNLVVTAAGHDKGTLKIVPSTGGDPNYADTATGYLAVLITNRHLNVFFVPQTIGVPYTGQIYTSDAVKNYDGDGPGSYQVWRVAVDDSGRPLGQSGGVIDVADIPTQGKDSQRLDRNMYRVEIGSPQHTPRDTGSYTTVVTDISGGYIGIGTLQINARTVGKITLDQSSGVYTGVGHSPTATVTDSAGQSLVLNRDYVLQIRDAAGAVVSSPVDAGTYEYTAVGINNYVGSVTENPAAYTVAPKLLGNQDLGGTDKIRGVILDAPGYATLNSGETSLTPRYSLYYNGMTLLRGADANADYHQTITVSGGAEVETVTGPGTYTFTIHGQGNYAGEVSFTLHVDQVTGDLRVTNASTFTYSGCVFSRYNWAQSATVNWSPEGGTTQGLDPYQFNISIERYADNHRESIEDVENTVLDAGLYVLTLTPSAALVESVNDGAFTADTKGVCVFQIDRREVTISPVEARKTYGQADPDFSTLPYTTDLPGAEANGFFAHDADRVSGSFSRNSGEDVRNSGYRYIPGTFTAGDNYLLTVGLENVFYIDAKSLDLPGAGQSDDITVVLRPTMSYIGYGLDPIQSVTYGKLALLEQASYVLSYQRWRAGGEECTPGCTQGHDHGWEDISVTPADVGWYRVTIDGDACLTTPDNYVGSRSYIYQIQAQGGDLELAVDGEAQVTYTGAPHRPIVSVRREGFALSGEYYSLSYSYSRSDGGVLETGTFTPGSTRFVNAGRYTIYAAGLGNYAGSAGSVTFTILPKDLAEGDGANGTPGVEITLPEDTFPYNGAEHRAGVNAVYNGQDLTAPGDYSLSYQNHINAGQASVTVTGAGNYTGTRTLPYTIEKRALTVEVKADTRSKVYGTADPTYEYTLTDAKGVQVTDPGLRLTGSVSRAPGEGRGEYPLDIGTLSAGENYTLTLKEGQVLTILPKALGKEQQSAADNISATCPHYVAGDTPVSGLKQVITLSYWAPALGRQGIGKDAYTLTVTRKGEATPLADTEKLTDGEFIVTVAAVEGAANNYTGTFQLPPVTVVNADSLITLVPDQTIQDNTLTYYPEKRTLTLTPMVKDGPLKGCSFTLLYNGEMREQTTGQDSFTFDLLDAGTYSITALKHADDTSGETYMGTVIYTVQPKDLGGSGITLATPEGDFSYTGAEVMPTNGDALLLYDGRTIPAREASGAVNYLVSCTGNVNPGKATVTLYGQGNYRGTCETYFQVGDARYRADYNGNGAIGGVPPVDRRLYLPNENVVVLGNSGQLRGAPGTLFLGWALVQTDHPITSRDELGDSLYISGSLYTMGEGNVTFYAVWAADSNTNGVPDCDEDRYSVTYTAAPSDHCSGGQLPVDSRTYLSGATVTVRQNLGALTLNGYLLLGWTPDGAGMDSLRLDTSEQYFNFVSAHYLYSEDRTFSMGQKDVTLTAVWGADANKNGVVDWMESKVQFFVTYDSNGGAGEVPASHALEPEVLSVEVAKEGACRITRSQCTFLGWTTQRRDEPLTAAPTADPNDPSYYAIYQKGDTHVIAYGDPNPVVFYALWAEDENGNGVADYEESRYTVRFENAAEGVSAEMPKEHTGNLTGISLTLPNTLAGISNNQYLTLLGWTQSRTEGEQIYARGLRPEGLLAPGSSFTVGGADVTLYPVWGEPGYDVSQYIITVTPTPGGGGQAFSDKTKALLGDTATVTIQVGDGYALGQVLENGVSKTPDASGDGGAAGRGFSLTMEDIQENKAVVVTFIRSELRAAWPAAVTYNAERQAPTLKVYKSDSSDTPVPADNYDLSVTLDGETVGWEDAFTGAGSYLITVTGKGEYAGSSITVPYVIAPAALTEVILTGGERPFKGAAYDDEIASVRAGALTVPQTGYTAVYQNNVHKGEATVTVTGLGNYQGTVVRTFTISAAGVNALAAGWEREPSITYDGQPHRPVPVVKVAGSGVTLREGVDYTLSYPDNVTDWGEKTVTVTGSDNFAGAKTEITYTVKQKSLAQDDAADGTAPVRLLPLGDRIYSGEPIRPEPILLYGTGRVLSLTQGSDFTAAYTSNTAVGVATVVITAVDGGNYTGECKATFQINAAGSGMTMTDQASLSYTGAAQALKADQLGVKFGGNALTPDADYTVEYIPIPSTGAALADGTTPRATGTYVVVVTGMGSYGGVLRGTLVIVPAQIDAVDTDGASSFQYDGQPHAPAIRSVRAGELTLDGETDYTVLYRDAQGHTSSAPPTGVGQYTMVVTGTGNFAGSRTLDFSIGVGPALTLGEVPNAVYNGLSYQPVPEVKDGKRTLAVNVDYTLSYSGDPTGAGEKSGTVTGINNYAGSAASFTYTVFAKDLSDGDRVGSISVAVPDQVYTGSALEPGVSVTYTTADGRVLFLTQGKDYTLEYSDNVNAGREAKVRVTGLGNYRGTVEKNFTITAVTGGRTLDLTLTPNTFAYDGGSHTPTVTVKDGDRTLTPDTDYTLRYSTADLVSAGTVTVTAVGRGNYLGSGGSADYAITPARLSGVTAPDIKQVYDGGEKTFSAGQLTVTARVDGRDVAVPNTGYTVAYQNNVDAGVATVTVTGVGNYQGAVSAAFTVAPRTLTVTPDAGQDKVYGEAEPDSYPYSHNGPAELAFTGALARVPGEAAGSYGFELGTLRALSGNYALTLAEDSPPFTVTPKSLGDAATVTPSAPLTVGYTGAAFDRAVTTQYAAPALGTLLVPGSDYVLSFAGGDSDTFTSAAPVNAGRYTVKVTGVGNYRDSYTFPLTISTAELGVSMADNTVTYDGHDWTGGIPARLTCASSGVTLTPGHLSYLDADGKAVDRIVNAGAYTVVVTVDNYDPVRLPFHVEPKDIGEVAFSAIGKLSYTGASHTPAPTAPGLAQDTDYTLAWRNNVDAGTGHVDVTGVGNYTGVKVLDFAIGKLDLRAAAISGLTSVEFDGQSHIEVPQVKVDGVLVSEGRDYTVAYTGSTTDAGTVTVTVTATEDGNCANSGSAAYEITRAEVKDAWLTVLPDALTYTGQALTPAVLVKRGSAVLTAGTDYTLTYKDNTDVGAATVTVTGMGNYTGTARAGFAITAAGGGALSVSLDRSVFTYNAQSQAPGAVTVAREGRTLTPEVDYTLSIPNAVNAGSYTVTVTGKGNYEGASGSAGFVINPAPLSAATAEYSSVTYDGTAKTPSLTVAAKDGALRPVGDTDYSVSYQNNTAAGAATVTVVGKGNYQGTLNAAFTIVPRTLTVIPAADQAKTYGETEPGSYGYSHDGPAELVLSGALARAPGEAVGSYAFELGTLREPGGNYALVLAESAPEFTVNAKDLRGDGVRKNGDMTLGYTGAAITPTVTTLYAAPALGSLLLTNQDYTLSYAPAAPGNVGGYTVTVTGVGNYTGSYEFRLTVSNAVLAVSMEGDTVTYDGGDWTRTMPGRLKASFGGRNVALSAGNLSYQDADGKAVDRIVNAGAYTVVVTVDNYDPVELPFHVEPRDIEEVAFGAIGKLSYTGAPHTPAPTAAGLAQNTDYTLAWRNNVDAGAGYVDITGVGNYTGVKTLDFTIAPRTLTEADVGALADVIYNGAGQRQAPGVKAGGVTLAEGRDYTLEYQGDSVNVTAGGVTVTVTGMGNYAGRVERRYAITPKTIRNFWITVNPGSLAYTGEPLEPLVLVKDSGAVLTRDTDYTLAYSGNTAVGENTATVTVTGVGNYTGTATGSFTITATGNRALTLTLADPGPFAYDGTSRTPAVTVKDGARTLDPATDYELSYAGNQDAGTATVTAKGKGNYEGAIGSASFVITPAALAEVEAEYRTVSYDGKAKTPGLTVTAKDGALRPAVGTDYDVSYQSNTAAGTATVTVVGKGNYQGSCQTTFEILPATLNITPAPGQGKTYGEADGTLSYTGSFADSTITDRPVFTGALNRTAGEEKGGYPFTLGTLRETSGNFTLALTPGEGVVYTVAPKDLGDTDVEKPDGLTLGYTGLAITPAVTMVYASPALGGLLVPKGSYTLSYAAADGTALAGAPTAVGSYTVTVSGQGNYTGGYSFPLTVSNAILGVGMDEDSVKYTKGVDWVAGSDTQAAIAQRLTASFNGSPVELEGAQVTYQDAEGGAVSAITDAGLYTVVVKVGNYAPVELPFQVLPRDVGDVLPDALPGVSYTGAAQTPDVAQASELEEGDFEAAYFNNTDVGTAQIVVTGKGNYQGVKTLTFPIGVTALPAAIPELDDVGYTGLVQRQKPQVQGLMEGRDYTLSYEGDSVNVTPAGVTVTIAGAGNYAGSWVTRTYHITPRSIDPETGTGSACSVTVTPALIPYTGQVQAPEVLVRDGQRVLTPGVDYTLTYPADAVNAGSYTITVTGVGNYTGARTVPFQISAAASGGGLEVTVDSSAVYVYDGQAKTPGVTVTGKDNREVLTEGRDFTVTYSNNVHAGRAAVSVSGLGNYAGSFGSAEFLIRPAQLAGVSLTDGGPITYDGGEKTPGLTVTATDSGLAPAEDRDYDVIYQNNIHAGTAAVAVTGKGDYTGTVTTAFSISPAVVTVTPDAGQGKAYGETDGGLSYTCGFADPAITAEAQLEGALARLPGENAGTYAFTLGSLRETSGDFRLELADEVFTVRPKDLSGGDITCQADLEVGYTGQVFDRAVTTLYASPALGSLLLTAGDYDLSFAPADPRDVGDYTATVTGKGNYTGSYDFRLTISDALLGVSMAQDTVTYDGTDWAGDILARLSCANSGVTLARENLSFRDAGGTAVSGMVDAGAYTVVVTVDNYGPVELPFHVEPADIGSVEFDPLDGQTYTGGELEPEPVSGEASGDDYTLAWRDNVNAGVGYVDVTGVGNYRGVQTLSFAISPKALGEGDVGALDDTAYTGWTQALRPAVTAEGAALTEGRDYTLSYRGDSVNVTGGGVTVTVTGVGNYRGTVERRYAITPKTVEKAWLTASPHTLTYTGSALEPTILVRDGGAVLAEGRDYTLAWRDNVAQGTGYADVTGIGNYRGQATVSFAITANTASLSVRADRTSHVYDGTSHTPAITVLDGVLPLLSGADYTAAYTFNGRDMGPYSPDSPMVNAGVYVITVSGTGNYAGATGSVSLLITPAALAVGEVGEQDYTGGPVTPLPTVTREGDGAPLTLDVDYVLSYNNNVNMGEKTATVTATGLGNYAGSSGSRAFTITGARTLFAVTYDGNGHTAGDPPVDSEGYLEGGVFTVMGSNRIQRRGGVFLGWTARAVTELVTSASGQAALDLLAPGQRLSMPRGGVTLYAVWGQDANLNGRPDYAETLTITASAGEGGSISPEGRQTVDWGAAQVSYTITPDANYRLSRLTVDGALVDLSTLSTQNGSYVYTFRDLNADHSILASFSRISNGGGGGGGGGGSGGGGGGGGGGSVAVVEPTGDPTLEELKRSGIDRWLNIDDHTAYLQGRKDGNFYPNAPLTRAEAATVFYRLLKEPQVAVTVHFDDVPSDAWYAVAVETLASLGILEGVGKGRFEPQRAITRAEFAAMATRLANRVQVGEVRNYTDVDPGRWFYEEVQLATYNGWMAGYPDSSFGPEREISRAEMAKVVNRMTGRIPDLTRIDGGAGVTFGDVPKTHWAYYEIVEAATGHGFDRVDRVETWDLP